MTAEKLEAEIKAKRNKDVYKRQEKTGTSNLPSFFRTDNTVKIISTISTAADKKRNNFTRFLFSLIIYTSGAEPCVRIYAV